MSLNKEPKDDGYIVCATIEAYILVSLACLQWRCAACRREGRRVSARLSIRAQSLFEDANIKFKDFLLLLAYWSSNPTSTLDAIHADTGLSKPTIVDWYNHFRDITQSWYAHPYAHFHSDLLGSNARRRPVFWVELEKWWRSTNPNSTDRNTTEEDRPQRVSMNGSSVSWNEEPISS